MRQLPRMGKIFEYSGELTWIDVAGAVPMAIRRFLIKDPGKWIVADFASKSDSTLDKYYYRYSTQAYADKSIDRRIEPESDWVANRALDQPIYVMEPLRPYRRNDARVHLEWKPKELRSLNGEAYCYVEVRWIEHDGKKYQCSHCVGLLRAHGEVETHVLPGNVDEASLTDGQ